jgi:hypothetical protein
MVNEWNARAEILAATHRWPVIMVFILVGSLVGASIAYLLPSPYRAESTMHVAYNADVHIRNPDDYKNGQMEQLNIFILSDEVLQETADRLNHQNNAWSDAAVDDLQTSLHVYWRNAGEWRLVAEASTPERAVDLLNTWQQVFLEQIQAATVHADTVLDLSTRVDAIYLERVDTNLRIAELNQIKAAIQTWIRANEGNKANNPLQAQERWFLLSRVSSAADWNPEGIALLEDVPQPEAAPSAYITWLEKTLVFIAQELDLLEPQSNLLSEEYDRLYAKWSEELEASRGLTAYLVVKPLDSENQPAQPVRPTALMAFVGGMLGLLIWALVWLMKPVRQARSQIT